MRAQFLTFESVAGPYSSKFARRDGPSDEAAARTIRSNRDLLTALAGARMVANHWDDPAPADLCSVCGGDHDRITREDSPECFDAWHAANASAAL